jgi:cytochrome c
MKSRIAVRSTVIGNVCKNSTRGGRATTRCAIVAVAVVAGLCGSAYADDADFAKSKKCMNCHALDEKRVGPPFKAVAARYANDPGAEERLAIKIREGGANVWGVVPMPANGEVSKAEAQRLAHWVLMQK